MQWPLEPRHGSTAIRDQSYLAVNTIVLKSSSYRIEDCGTRCTCNACLSADLIPAASNAGSGRTRYTPVFPSSMRCPASGSLLFSVSHACLQLMVRTCLLAILDLLLLQLRSEAWKSTQPHSIHQTRFEGPDRSSSLCKVGTTQKRGDREHAHNLQHTAIGFA